MRTILFCLALLGAVVGRGQIVLDWYTQAAAAALLLDDYPNAAAAYSLRLLNSAYTGDCMVVQKRGTSDTLAIGFLGNYLDTASIVTFCGATNCDVRRWYDQSGNNNDLIQTDATRQPNLYTGTAFQTVGGKIGIKGDGSNDRMIASFTRNQPHTFFYTGTTVSGDICADGVSATQNNFASLFNNSGVMRVAGVTSSTVISFNLSFNTANHHLLSVLWDGANSQAQANTTTASGSTGVEGANGLTLFSAATGVIPNAGFTQEAIIYNSDNTADWSGIQSNINSFYNIY